MKSLLGFGGVVCSLVIAMCLGGMAKSKSTIVVMDFQNKSKIGGFVLGSGASDMLTTALVKTRKFDVIERDKLKSLLKEQQLGESGLVDSSRASKLGKLLGAQYVVVGSITEYGMSKQSGGVAGISGSKTIYRTAVDVRIIDTTTGKIIYAENGNGEESSSSANIMGLAGGGSEESFNEKKGNESLRKAINDVCDKLKKESLDE